MKFSQHGATPTRTYIRLLLSGHVRMILITGATGFLGQAIARAMLASRSSVRVLAREQSRAAPLAALGAQVHVGDLRDAASVAGACHGVTQVVHCGALSSPWGARQDF